MFLPYRDENPTQRTPVLTILLILGNVAFFMYQVFGDGGFAHITIEYGLIPLELVSGRNLPVSGSIPPCASLFTYMFCHGSISHLLFNMLFLWIFGNNIEDRMSPGRFLAFYIIIGIISAGAFVVMAPGLSTPLVGASGAISGILGAYLFMFPMARVHVWMIFFVLRMPALVFLPIWFMMQIFGFMGQTSGGGGNVAWISHIAGFIAGVVLFRLFTRPRSRRKVF